MMIMDDLASRRCEIVPIINGTLSIKLRRDPSRPFRIHPLVFRQVPKFSSLQIFEQFFSPNLFSHKFYRFNFFPQFFYPSVSPYPSAPTHNFFASIFFHSDIQVFDVFEFASNRRIQFSELFGCPTLFILYSLELDFAQRWLIRCVTVWQKVYGF